MGSSTNPIQKLANTEIQRIRNVDLDLIECLQLYSLCTRDIPKMLPSLDMLGDVLGEPLAEQLRQHLELEKTYNLLFESVERQKQEKKALEEAARARAAEAAATAGMEKENSLGGERPAGMGHPPPTKNKTNLAVIGLEEEFVVDTGPLMQLATEVRDSARVVMRAVKANISVERRRQLLEKYQLLFGEAGGSGGGGVSGGGGGAFHAGGGVGNKHSAVTRVAGERGSMLYADITGGEGSALEAAAAAAAKLPPHGAHMRGLRAFAASLHTMQEGTSERSNGQNLPMGIKARDQDTELESRKELQRLLTKLEQVRAAHERETTEATRTINSLRSQTVGMQEIFERDGKKLVRRMELQQKEDEGHFQLGFLDQEKKLSELERQVNEKTQANKSKEDYLRRKTHRLEKEVENWVLKYDDEMQEKEQLLLTLRTEHSGQQGSLTQLLVEIDELTNEKARLLQMAKDAAELKEREELIRQQVLAVGTINRWWKVQAKKRKRSKSRKAPRAGAPAPPKKK